MLKYKNINKNDLWYLVGLITSDGSLSKSGRHVSITSKDCDFLENIKRRLKITNIVGKKYRGNDGYRNDETYYHIQISSIEFYEFLISIGLFPNKSTTIKAVNVPGLYFNDFLRGVIDGDGSIMKWVHSTNKREQWSLKICSGSADFIEWLNNEIQKKYNVVGRIYKQKTLYILKYGKMVARKILSNCYYKNSLNLERKHKLAEECIRSYNGWSKSKTILK